MNRKIEYRVWSIYDARWVTGSVSINSDGKIIIFYTDGKNFHCFPKPNENFIIQQKVGIQDKYGKDIYEGDIVRVYEENIFAVKYGKINRKVVAHGNETIIDAEINCFYFESVPAKLECFSIRYNFNRTHDLTETVVIGNIIENPKLLEKTL